MSPSPATRKVRITEVERILLWVPMVERVRRDMERAGIHTWSEVELIRLTTDAGVVGWGETIQNYTWGKVDDTERVIGRSPFELMWDDSLGAGLQMALFDAAGKLAELPIHGLLGAQVRDHCPWSFWDHDMSPERYEVEVEEAVRLGYTSMKIKTRPWFDVYQTISRMSAATPDWFAIDADWNDHLIDSSTALPVLLELEQAFPKLHIFEGPIRSTDLEGNRRLTAQLRTAVAHHYGSVPARSAITGGYCDGFVVGGGMSATMAAGRVTEAANMPLFLQMVGTGLTATLSLQVGAVLPAARWPGINCHELYEHCLLPQRIPVIGGLAAVPAAPGLGVTVDEQAIAKYRVDSADLSLPRRVVRYERPSGVVVYFSQEARPGSAMWNYFQQGNQPRFERGVSTELVDDDGSPEFADIAQRVLDGPLVTAADR